MGIIQRQSAYSTVITYFGYAIGAFNALYLYTNYLEDDQKGVIDLIMVLVTTFVSIGSCGTFETIYKFLPFYKAHTTTHTNDIFTKTLLYGLFTITLSVILFFIFKENFRDLLGKSQQLTEYLYLFPVFIFGNFIFLFLNTYVIGYQHAIFSSLIQEVFIRVFNTIVIFLYIFKLLDFDQLIIVISTQYWLAAIPLFSLLYIKGYVRIVWNNSRLTARIYKKIIGYISFYWVALALNNFARIADKIFLGNMLGARAVAYFSVAEYLITVIGVPFKSVVTTSVPLIAESARKNDVKHLQLIYEKSANTITLIGGILFVLITASIYQLYAVIPISYGVGVSIFIVLGITRMLDFVTSVNGHIMLYYRKFYRFELGLGIMIGLLIVPATYYLINYFGIIGSAYAQLLVFFIVNSIRYLYLKIKINLSPFRNNKNAFLFIFVMIFLGLMLMQINPTWFTNKYINSIVVTLAKSSTIGLIFLTVILKTNVSPDLGRFAQVHLDKMLNNIKGRI